MGFINIDDRDTHNYFLPSKDEDRITYKQWLMELKANNPTAKIIPLGDGRYQLDLPVITCTGLDINTRFNIPHMHQLIRTTIKHADSDDNNSTDNLDYSLSKRLGSNLLVLLLNIEASTASDILDEYIGYYMELGEYLILSKSTNTDRLHINIVIRIIGV